MFNYMKKSKNIPLYETDVLIIGAGIMGATLGSILKELDSSLRVDIVESLNSPALESSKALNNAGTGHAGYCELNYTPLLPNNKIDIQKAHLPIYQMWAYPAVVAPEPIRNEVCTNPEKY